jgi:hypothetical protein
VVWHGTQRERTNQGKGGDDHVLLAPCCFRSCVLSGQVINFVALFLDYTTTRPARGRLYFTSVRLAYRYRMRLRILLQYGYPNNSI